MDKLISELTNFIKNRYLPEEKVSTSRDGGQTTFYRKGGKSLCYIESKSGRSVVTVVIGASLSERIHAVKLSPRTKKMYDDAKPFHDGKWLFFEVKTETDLEDIKTLLTIKRTPKVSSMSTSAL